MKEKVFNYMQRSAELMQGGVPDEEAIAILAKEEAEADFTVLDDGAWFQLLNDIRDMDLESGYQEELARERESDAKNVPLEE